MSRQTGVKAPGDAGGVLKTFGTDPQAEIILFGDGDQRFETLVDTRRIVRKVNGVCGCNAEKLFLVPAQRFEKAWVANSKAGK